MRFVHVAVQRPMGELSEPRMAIVACPHCSYFRDGSCIPCEDGEAHPACEGCVGARPVWYRRPIVQSLATAVAVSIVTTVILNRAAKTDWFRGLIG